MELHINDTNQKLIVGLPRSSNKLGDIQTLALYETFDRACGDNTDFTQAFKELNDAIELASEKARMCAINRAISDLFGFETSKINLINISTMGGVPMSVGFNVNGRGFYTDFEDLCFDESLNDQSDK